MIEVQTDRTSDRRDTPARPLALFISLIRDKGGTTDDELRHIRALKAALAEEGYEEFRDAIIDEWARIKYTTAFAAAFPPTASELRHRLERQKRRTAEERRRINAAKFKIVKRALSLLMPNGKPLAQPAPSAFGSAAGWWLSASVLGRIVWSATFSTMPIWRVWRRGMGDREAG
jgi:hypothetical protein